MLLRCCAGSAMMLCGLLVGAAAAGAEDATPAAVRVVEERTVAIEDGVPLALSPDGRWLAVERRDRDEICAYDTDTVQATVCVALAIRSIDHGTAVWSPDGTRLAFTENALWYLDESDIWVFDAESGTVTNLTDDAVDSMFPGGQGAPLDLAPAWSPDGTELVFARTTEEADDEYVTAIYRIAADGGDPRQILHVAGERFVVPAGVAWRSDGSILYTIYSFEDESTNGIWAIAPGGEPRRLVAAADLGVEAVILVGVAGKRALLATFAETGVSFYLLDLTRGDAAAVESADPEQRRVTAAGLSPDGTRLLVGYFDHAAVRDLTSGAEQPLGPLDWQVFATGYNGGLTWATNDLVYGTGPGSSGMLLRLTTG